VPAEQAAEWRRQKRLKLESLPADKFPLVVAFAASYARVPDIERYYAFGLDLVMAGVEAMAPGSARSTGPKLDQTIGATAT